MSDFYRYEFDSELDILFKCYYGSISIDNIFSSWKHAFKTKVFPLDVRGFVLDFRECTFDFTVNRFIEIVDFYKKHIHIYKDKKVALISTNPSDLVISILFSSKDKGYTSKSFSTREAAIEWVLN